MSGRTQRSTQWPPCRSLCGGRGEQDVLPPLHIHGSPTRAEFWAGPVGEWGQIHSSRSFQSKGQTEANQDHHQISRAGQHFWRGVCRGISGTTEHHLDVEEEGFHPVISLGINKKRTISLYRRQAQCRSVMETGVRSLLFLVIKMPGLLITAGLKCSIHTTQKVLQTSQSVKLPSVKPVQGGRGSLQSCSSLPSRGDHVAEAQATPPLPVQGWHSELAGGTDSPFPAWAPSPSEEGKHLFSGW